MERTTFVIDDKFKEKSGVNVGKDPVIVLKNVDRLVSMKLEITGEGLLKGFVNYNQSHNKNEKAKNDEQFVFNRNASATKDKPSLYRINSDTNAVIDLERLQTGKSVSLYIELADPSGRAKAQADGDTLAMYYDNSSSSNLLPIIISIVILFVLISVLVFAKREKRDLLDNFI